ncbi:MAG: RsiW-degrading membrane proteinase PrsW (M82 family) [Roseivirga sp.]|jgi:RsiW-degrading membrane proteinase PrsW (M82 family)
MGIDDLKNTWKSAGESHRTSSELKLMTELKHNRRLKRIRRRLLIESILVLAFLTLFYTGLDGADKPLWTIVTLILSGVVYIINRLIGYHKTQNIKPDTTVYQMSQDLIKQLKRLSVTSGMSALFFGAAVILFMTIEIEFNVQKYTMLAGLIVSLFAFSFLSYNIWKKQISRLQQIIHQLSGDS